MRPVESQSFVVLLALVFHCSSSFASNSLRIDFVGDRAFPESQSGNEKKRELSESLVYRQAGLVITVTGENESGDAVEVSRRGPGGLGVKGNGDRDVTGKGTTSGNRVNNGESLILRFTNEQDKPQPVFVRSIVIDRIVRDTENFPDADITRYQLVSGSKVIGSGELPTKPGSTRGGPISVSVDSNEPTTELRITNGTPFHPIANRFRVSAIALIPAE